MANLQSFLRDRCLTVLNLPDKGRSLFTSRDFRPGEVILRQEPYVSVPNNNSSESRCDGCFKTDGLKKCSGCQVVWYCGSSCQKSEWKLHRHECKALCRLEKEKRMLVTPTIRLMVKLCLKRNLQNEKVIPITTTDNYSLVEALVSHMSELDEKQLMLYAQMANLVNLILQFPGIDLKEIAENFSKFSCNAHSICDSELRPEGIGLFPLVSIINHSCSPNAVLVFEEKMAVVRAMEYISKDSEVTISYIETAGSTLTRQKSLKEQYLFHCQCARCSNIGKPHDIEESAILEGYRCANEKCNGFLLRDPDDKGFVCQNCMLLRSKEEVKKLAGDVKTVSAKALASPSAESICCLHKQDAIALYKTFEKLQEKLYHSFSITLMRTREKLLKMLMEVESWREALDYCKLIVPVYQRVYPATHPLIGLQFYTQGKLEWLLGQTEEAVSSLIKAYDILRISHGTSTPFMKELSAKLDEARAEASYKLLALKDGN
ncbi:histone-lysine N-methyltransferase ASHR1 isoform X2 [Brassica rapa]|uniref:histone-lysine N-methyltransferase ASHR1 isoform X1 n=1 Tax=Brassica campestris TaxID=3711 RepID=UPI0004F19A3A|nr:histone-lysine N-methyltransferase ASHR1 isoform X1 [Brassica rapa]XP_009121062.1 histone-lysine N-methyltransferase ASHR1 isoform X2 [Brassica rapa]